MATYALHRASFNGMSTTLTEGSFQDCQARLARIARRYTTNERYSYNREVSWLIPSRKLEITDEGLGLIGDDCGIYSIEKIEEHHS